MVVAALLLNCLHRLQREAVRYRLLDEAPVFKNRYGQAEVLELGGIYSNKFIRQHWNVC